MDKAQMAEIYRNRQVMTASPAELTLMLYNGAIRFCMESGKALENKNFSQAHEANIKAQRIISELSVTLDMSQPISKDWRRLYEYISYCLIQANLRKDRQKLDEACDMIREFKDTWQQVMQKVATQKTMDITAQQRGYA